MKLSEVKNWRQLGSLLRKGGRELGGAREFLRAARKHWYMWAAIVYNIVLVQSFVLMAVLGVCAMFGATFMEWTLAGYQKMLDGYGTMIDQQQRIIHKFQHERENENGNGHPSEKAARNRIRGMN